MILRLTLGSLWFLLLLVVQKNLEVGEVLSVDVSCIAAVTGTVNIQIKFNGTMRRALFGVSCFNFLKFALFLLVLVFLPHSWLVLHSQRSKALPRINMVGCQCQRQERFRKCLDYRDNQISMILV